MIHQALKINKLLSVMAIFLIVIILSEILFGSVILAIEEEDHVFVNGTGYPIKPIYVENKNYLHTDSYYVPLREIFEAMGFQVVWDSKHKLNLQRDNGMPTIDMISPNGQTFTIQLGNDFVLGSRSWSPPPLIIEGTAYITLRALSYILTPDDQVGGMRWNAEKNDTYFSGNLHWDETTRTITIETSFKKEGQ